MKIVHVSVLLAGLMTVAAAGSIAVRPSTKASADAPRYLLEDIVPKQFGQWRELPQRGAQVVNPQTQQLLDKLYSQILNRIYVNEAGYQIMLALAYGDDQRGALQAHKPEVCYPAQGFALHSNVEAPVETPFGSIPARRLSTTMGARKEPVTYWFTVGDTAVKNKVEKRIVEIRLGLTGQIPDGLLFRVSSIDSSPEHAFVEQDKFVVDLLQALDAKNRLRLSGLQNPG